MFVIASLEIKNEGIPKLFSQYLLKKAEWDPLKNYLKNDLDLVIRDEELSTDKIFVNKNTLTFSEDYNEKHIEAFKIIHKNAFFNFDILQFIRNSIKKPDNSLFFEMDDPTENKVIEHYLKTKKNTPEFSHVDDEKIKNFIKETQKTVKLFKNND
jgi:hypothetical protein